MKVEAADQNDWVLPYEDADDEDELWCTQAGSESSWSPFQCSKIKCLMQRKLVTEDDKDFTTDTQEDFALAPASNNGQDVLTIRQGRARLFFNKDTYTSGYELMLSSTETAIAIYSSASHIIASSVALGALTFAALQ